MKHTVLCLALFAAVAAWSIPAAYADSSAKMTKEDKRAAKEAKKEEKRAAKEAKKLERDAKKADKEGDKDVKAAEKEEEAAKNTEKKAVAKAFKKLKPIAPGKISGSAKYIFYYHTNSALTVSEENLDLLVEQSKELKKAKVSVLLISHDRDNSNAVKFYKEHKANFPAVAATDEMLAEMPGYIPSEAAPFVTIVDSCGNLKYNEDGSILERWKDCLSDDAESDTKDNKNAKDAE